MKSRIDIRKREYKRLMEKYSVFSNYHPFEIGIKVEFSENLSNSDKSAIMNHHTYSIPYLVSLLSGKRYNINDKIVSAVEELKESIEKRLKNKIDLENTRKFDKWK